MIKARLNQLKEQFSKEFIYQKYIEENMTIAELKREINKINSEASMYDVCVLLKHYDLIREKSPLMQKPKKQMSEVLAKFAESKGIDLNNTNILDILKNAKK